MSRGRAILGSILRRRRLAIELAVALLVLWLVRAYTLRDVVEGPAPRLEGVLLSGEPFHEEMLSGEPYVLYFWASFCGVCRAMEGTIADLAVDHRVITVASWSGEASRLQANRGDGGPPTIVDPEGTLAARFGVRSVPTVFIVDRDGFIRFREVGYTTRLGLAARLWFSR